MSENAPAAKKAAAARGASADQGQGNPPEQRKTPEQAQQQASSADIDADLDDDKTTAEELLTALEDAVERAEAAAERAEAAAAGLPVDGARAAVKIERTKEPEIGSPEWQRENQLSALREELGFAEAKKQTDRVKAIKAEISRVEKD